VFQNKAVVYAILFRAAAETLATIAADSRHLGAQLGMTMVLHTWGQTLQHHPHVHCVVPGGGPSLDGTRWVACRPGFFLPVRVLSRLFRRLFLQELENAFGAGKLRFFTNLANLAEPQAFARRLRELQRLDWVVYAKPPFGSPEQVLAYLGRYTHRVAIANSRLLSLADGKLRFTWKDYRADGKTKVMTLDADEFKAIARSPLLTSPSVLIAVAPCGGSQSCHASATHSHSPVTRHDVPTDAHRDRARSQSCGQRCLRRHRAADQSLQSRMPTVPAPEIDATAPHSPRSPVPRADYLLSARTPQPKLNVKRQQAFATIPIVPNLPRLRSIRLL
jgi:hypothetical protein